MALCNKFASMASSILQQKGIYPLIFNVQGLVNNTIPIHPTQTHCTEAQRTQKLTPQPGDISLIANLATGYLEPCKWLHLHLNQVAECSTKITQVTESISGSVVPLPMYKEHGLF